MLRAISASNAWFPPGYSGSLSTSLPLYTLLGLTLDCAGSRLSSFGVVGIPNLLSGVSLSVSFCSSNSCCNVLCNTSLEIRKPLNLEGAYPENADTTSKLNVFPPRYVENNKYPLFYPIARHQVEQVYGQTAACLLCHSLYLKFIAAISASRTSNAGNMPITIHSGIAFERHIYRITLGRNGKLVCAKSHDS